MQQLPVKNICFDVSNALDISSTIVKKHSQSKLSPKTGVAFIYRSTPLYLFC